MVGGSRHTRFHDLTVPAELQAVWSISCILNIRTVRLMILHCDVCLCLSCNSTDALFMWHVIHDVYPELYYAQTSIAKARINSTIFFNLVVVLANRLSLLSTSNLTVYAVSRSPLCMTNLLSSASRRTPFLASGSSSVRVFECSLPAVSYSLVYRDVWRCGYGVCRR